MDVIVDGFEVGTGQGMYFIRSADLIKIGKTNYLPQRMAAIRSHNPDARLINFFPSVYPYDLERTIHQRFAHRRRGGEWFDMTPDDLKAAEMVARRTNDQTLLRRREAQRRQHGSGSLRGKDEGVWEMRYKGKSRMFRGAVEQAEIALEQFVEELDNEPPNQVKPKPQSKSPGSMVRLSDSRTGAARWKLRYGCGPDPSSPGKYRYVSRSFTGTEAEAKRELAKLVASVLERRRVASPDTTMAALIERWLEHTDHEAATVRGYRGLARRHINPVIGKVPLSQLEPMHIERVLLKIRRQGLSERTAQQTYSVMHASLERAFRWRWLTYNPAAQVDRPRITKYEIRLPEMRDLVRGIAEIREFDPMLGEAAAFVLFSTGLRRAELCALRWDDVEPGRIRVRHAIDADEHSLKTPKSGQRRDIHLDQLSAGLLDRRWRDAVRAAETGRWQLTRESFVWTRDDTGRANWRPDQVTKSWAAATKRVGLDGVRFHDLRHGHVSLLMQAGVPVPEISKRMGHASKVMTLDVYSHFSPADAAAPLALERAQNALLDAR